MEHFIVSARKYRPSTFKEVVGQDSITRTLKNAIRSGQIAQAFLFTGPRGVGKTTCARIMAKTINCLNPTSDTEPCNECESCKSFNTTASFNIHELDAASNNSVDDIRSLVDQVRIPPQTGKYKVYIIDEVHMLSASAFNAFLKTLEEPPAYAKFILATTEKHRIIPTILSRCQVYDFQRIRTEDISKHLVYVAAQENIEFEPEALQVIARKADGALRDALSIFDQLVSFSEGKITYKDVIENLNVLDQEYYFRTINHLLESDVPALLHLIEEVVSRGFDAHHYIVGLGDHLRSLLMSKDTRTLELIEASEVVKQQFASQASSCNASFLIDALALQNRCDLDYKNSSNKRLLLELSIIQMAGLTAEGTSSKEVPKPIVVEEKKKTEPISAVPPKPAAAAPPKEVDPVKPTVEPISAAKEPQSKSTSGYTPSIKAALQSKSKNGETESSNKDPEERIQSQPTNFDDEQFMEVWNLWLREIEHDQPSLVSGLRLNKPEIQENSVVKIVVGNSILYDGFLSHRPKLLERLRNKFNNPTLYVEAELGEDSGQSRPYTNREKFAAMTEMNENLSKFRDTFDLEID